ncbi:hypothetical protein K1Y28_00485 [Staphylococcus warneri]|jgi:hypothetical protein|uniref:Uncharacterized protein n=1 Tax=uncultured Caudovirales phage TaxID=2100421 RepID=A0A2H4J6Z0_9CAUD|nr:hypothetical protein [Staphylococcus warneri]ASN69107.1 hypothetical protein 3S9_65 [uncultured Caudovirales phage]MCD8803116.1 hypothetical protein [Staphylococcus warneri]MCD8806470.1 hypothetical protein [Staphylococcus warneri]MCI2788462.1 hypothetical protein [Staphylococcus warneri]
MNKLINQVYIIETNDGDFYEEEVQVNGGMGIRNPILKVTQYPHEAKRFSSIKEANDIAYAYGFNVLALNTYLEDVT